MFVDEPLSELNWVLRGVKSLLRLYINMMLLSTMMNLTKLKRQADARYPDT